MSIFGGSASGTSNPYAMNPYRIGGLPSTSQLNRSGGFRAPPAGFQFGAPQIARGFMPSFGGLGSMDTLGELGSIGRKQAGVLRTENDSKKKSDEKRGIGKKIMDLLSGESGAAVGGVAQGAGTAIGAYLNRRSNQEMTKLEREKFEEERRRESLREKERERIRALLAPTIESFRPR